jgi:hypothetical protein
VKGDFELESAAARSLVDLFEQAKKCQQLYEQAHMALPEPLRRVLGLNGSDGRNVGPKAPAIPAPERRDAPKEATADWVRIDAKAASTTAITLAVLRSAKKPMRARDLNDRVLAILPNILRGSISNVGTRLEGTLIQRTDEGWSLIDPNKAGIVHNGFLWSPIEALGKQEIAAHRREAIVYILQLFNSGLQIVQIVEHLGNCEWVHAPMNKDLVKIDVQILSEEGKVRRRGNTKKWEFVPPENGNNG